MRLRALALVLLAVCAAPSAFALTRSWTGAVSANWSESGNWSPAGVPTPADKLIFPAGVAHTVMTNDLPAWTSFGAMDFRVGYVVNGNPLTLIGDLTFDRSTNPSFQWNVDTRLGASVRFGAAIISRYGGAIDVNGHTLTIESYNTTIAGALQGTGSIIVNASGITIMNPGPYSGTITGVVDVRAALPDATITGGLSGYGPVGSVSSVGHLYPGWKMPCCSDPHSIGTLETKSVSITGPAYFDLAPGQASDLLRVNGTVALGGNTLSLHVTAGAPGAGETFTIIDNDGTDAVSGTFAGLPEGATVTLGSATLTITYRGGDGNDVVLATAAAAKRWTGAVNALWSNPGNWHPASIPAPGEALVFPAGVERTNMTNDLPAYATVGGMDFRADYTLSGNPLTLTGDLSFDRSVNPNFLCNVDLRLGTTVRFGAAIINRFTGAIDVNGQTLAIDSYNTTLAGPINGTGAITIDAAGVSITEDGSFAGTITGNVDVTGSLPNASIHGGLRGNGAVGTANVIGELFLGPQMPSSSADMHLIGTLQTKSITIASTMRVDLVPGSASDQLQVAGTVTLGGDALIVSLPGGSIGAGQSFTIIDNDGTDAVNGTFAGLAEGAAISLGGATLTLSYAGGDGNDVVLSTATSTKSWTGAVSALWSDPANWSPTGIPSPGEPLIFPAGLERTEMTNDLPAWTTVGALDFRSGYTLSGNPLTLDGNLTFDQSVNPHFVCNVGLKLAAPVQLGAAIQSFYNGAIDVNGQTLTIHSYNTTFTGAIDGTGAIVVHGSGVSINGNGTFNGTITGSVDVNGALPGATIAGGRLSGSGAVAAVSLTDAPLYLGTQMPAVTSDMHIIGTLQTKDVSIGGDLYVDITPDAWDRLQVTGTVTLGGPAPFISVPTGSPAAGQTFIIIDNDGTDPVAGTFAGQPEDSVIASEPWKFRVHYQGGDGNDVALMAIDATFTESAQNATSTQFGETTTFTARVTSRSGVTPTGTVTFTDDGTVIGTAPLTGGFASFAAATLDPGEHTITAQFDGTPIFAPSASELSHKVLRGKTTTTFDALASSILYGTDATLSVAVQAVAPATGSPSGAITLQTNAASSGTATLTHGQAVLALGTLDAGTHTLRVAYAGDARFEPSDSATASVTVLKAPTVIEAAGGYDTIGVRVMAPHRPSLAVAGVITIAEDGVILTQQSLAAGNVTVALPQLATGEHRLVIAYLGTGNFEASTTELTYAVAAPQLSVRDVVVSEGDRGERIASVRVELSWATPDTVTVAYATADQAAKDGEDYRGARGTLTFAPYETVRTIDLPVYGDTTSEPDERLEVTLAAPQNAALGRSRATVLISNDDLPYRALFDLAYANGLTLDLYTPVEGLGPFPVIVWIPGGSEYDAGDPFAPALRQTARGYAVATVRYRSPAAARFPAQLDDLRNAIAWLRANAAQYALEARRIAVWGASSSAHLASLLGVTEPVQAVIAWGGASDLARLQEDATSASCATKFNDRTSPQSTLLGCSLPSCAEKAASASPVNFATDDDPAFFLMHGTSDCVVPPMQSTRLYEALRAAGAEATLKSVSGGAPSTWTSPEVLSAVDAFLDAELKASTRRRTVRQ